MLERFAIALSLIALGWLAYWVFQQRLFRRNRSQSLGLPGYQPDVATILYFTTPGCVPCQAIQQPALASIKERYGATVNVLQFDASERPQLADAWGVLGAPTTFIIDRQGRPRGVNHGVARARKLEGQLRAIGIEPTEAKPATQRPLAPSREL